MFACLSLSLWKINDNVTEEKRRGALQRFSALLWERQDIGGFIDTPVLAVQCPHPPVIYEKNTYFRLLLPEEVECLPEKSFYLLLVYP